MLAFRTMHGILHTAWLLIVTDLMPDAASHDRVNMIHHFCQRINIRIVAECHRMAKGQSVE